jgi:flagellar hook assembly protein FlgD
VGASEPARGRAGPWLLVGLLVLALAAFTVTRALRTRDDVVNTVSLTERIGPGEHAEIRFTTTNPDADADVLITDTEDRRVRALLLDGTLEAGEHRFRWDGDDDAGERVAAGEYGFRVVLGEQDRDIKPPGRIRVEG